MQAISSPRLVLAALVLLTIATAAWASGATFAITGQGITLGEGKDVEEAGKEIQRFSAKATVGAPFTLTAQGIVLPRGGQAQPGEPDEGVWTVAGKSLKTIAAPALADKTKIAIRLEPTAAGPSRVRFEGKILGYDRTFEVVVDVAAKP